MLHQYCPESSVMGYFRDVVHKKCSWDWHKASAREHVMRLWCFPRLFVPSQHHSQHIPEKVSTSLEVDPFTIPYH